MNGEATASVPVVRLNTVLDWWKGSEDHLTKQADDRFREAWSRGCESSEAIDCCYVHVPNTDAAHQSGAASRVYLTTSVNQSYGSTVKGEEARGKAHCAVVLELEVKREDDHHVATRMCGASCPCIHSIIRCSHQLCLALLVFGMKSNSAAVGTAKKSPKKPKNFKGVLRIGYFASQEAGSIDVVLAQMSLSAEEQAAVKEIFHNKKTTKKDTRKAATRGTKQNASLMAHTAETRSTVQACFERNALADRRGFLATGMLTAHLQRKFFPTRENDVGAAQTAFVTKQVRQLHSPQGVPVAAPACAAALLHAALAHRDRGKQVVWG